MIEEESWPPILPSYCFAEYAFEADPQQRLGLASRREAVAAVSARTVGVCDAALVEKPRSKVRAWAVMYEDMEGYKCWSLVGKGEIGWRE